MHKVQEKTINENGNMEILLRYFDNVCTPAQLLDTLESFTELMLKIQLCATDKSSPLRFYLDEDSHVIQSLLGFKAVMVAVVNYEKPFFE